MRHRFFLPIRQFPLPSFVLVLAMLFIGLQGTPAYAQYSCPYNVSGMSTWAVSTTPLAKLNSVGIGQSYGVVATATGSGSPYCQNAGAGNRLGTQVYFMLGSNDTLTASGYWPSGVAGVEFKVSVYYTPYNGTQGWYEVKNKVSAPAGITAATLVPDSYSCADSGVGVTCYFNSRHDWRIEAIRTGTTPAGTTSLALGERALNASVRHYDTITSFNTSGAIYQDGAIYTIRQFSAGSIPFANPADCTADPSSPNPGSIDMKPAVVRWADFSSNTDGFKVNPEWTPVKLSVACSGSAQIRFSAADATTAAPNADALGRLVNASNIGANTGVQIFYKTTGDASCSGAPNLAGGTPLQLNKTQPVVLDRGTGTAATVNLCARYYTTASTDAALTKGAVTSTLRYTFAYE